MTVHPLAELASIADLVGSTRVDGIPMVFAPRDGQIAAGLLFRVGRADETLATAGITHLVEHLALFSQNMTDMHHNGETNDSYTHFHVVGGETEVVKFLNAVCAALGDLPLHRLDIEKEILRTEAARRSNFAGNTQRIERYGAAGPALASQEEIGLHAITADNVLEWSRTRFTRGNVALWSTTSEPLPGLDLSLPEGDARPFPLHTEVLAVKPAYFPGAPGGVFIDAIVPRSTAGSMFAKVASRALFRALRQEGGYSYSAECEYDPIDADHASISIHADALPKQQAAVVGGMVDVLAALRAGTVDDTDLAHARSLMRQMTEIPSLGAAMLPGVALNLLTGVEAVHPVAHLVETDAVTASEIAAVADLVWRDALAQIPEGALDWAGFSLAPRFSAETVTGEWYPRIDDESLGLLIGPEGVSFTTPHGPSTVLFENCVGYLTIPDGARVLVGADGFRASIEPTLHYWMTEEVIADLDARIPNHLVIPFPPRQPGDIPARPAGRLDKIGARPLRRGLGIWALLLGMPMVLISLAFLLGLQQAVGYLETPDPDGDLWTVGDLVFYAVLAVASLAVTTWLFVGYEARRKWKLAQRTTTVGS